MISFIRIACIVLIAFCFGAQSSPADDSIGFVKKVDGSATILREKAVLKVKSGDPIHMNDTVKTDASGSVGITFKDNAVISVGPNTVFTIDEYVYKPADNKLSFVSTVSKGTLSFVSGNLTKLKPDAVKVKTSVGTIGIRGTRFLLKVDED